MSDPLPPTVVQADGVPIAAPPDPDAPPFGPPVEPGELGTLGPYRVQKLLGKGGMGAVYRALDVGLQRPVALKVMLPRYAADRDSNERFRREARAAAAVRHDNVVTMYQVGEHGGMPFIAMELLSGYPLDEYLRRKGRLTVAQALRVGAETASGLAAAHALGLVHRDIKPANLWLEAPQGRIKILDFGLAKPAAATPDATELTGAGAVMGTPAYMSPEQTRGEKADARADLFSLGIVLYQLTTGKRPFDRATAMATAVAVASEEPPPVRSLNPDLPEPVADLIHALLAKDPAARPQPAAEVARRLRELERGGVPTTAAVEVTQPPTAPQVVYVPIQVTAYEPGASAFENLDRDDPTAADAPDTPVAAPSVRRPAARRPRFPWAAAAVAGPLLAVGGACAYFALFARKPAETAVAPGPQNPDGPKSGGVTLSSSTDPQREFVEWVLNKGGSVRIGANEVKPGELLPAGPLNVTGVAFPRAAHLTAADAEKFRVCPNLTWLQFGPSALTEAAFKALVALPSAEKWQTLGISDPKFPPAALAQLARCQSLYSLHASRMPLSGHLKFLAEMPNLRTFSTYDSDLIDDDLAGLKNTPLAGLIVRNSKRITPAGLDQLVAARVTLGELDVNTTGVKGRAGAEAVARFTKLVSLTANALDWTDDDAALLRPLVGLRTMYLSDNPKLTDRVAETLRDLPELSVLLLIRTGLTDAGLKRLHDRKAFALLHLEETKVTLAGVKAFQDAVPDCVVHFDYKPADDTDRTLAAWVLANGGEVSVAAPRPADARGAPGVLDVKEAVKLPPGALRVLGVRTGPTHRLADADVVRFRGCDRVRSIVSAHTQTDLTDAGFNALAELPQAERFETLVLRSLRATGAGVAHLAKLPALHTLDVSGAKLGDNPPDPLPAFPKLVSFTADGCQLTDAGVAKLGRRALTWLSIPHNPTVSADGAAAVVGPDLTFLDLEGTGADDKAMLKAAGLAGLERLRVRNTAVTDVGLVAVAGAKALTTLDVQGTKVTVVGAKRFKYERERAGLPKCDPVYTYDPKTDPDRRLAEWLVGRGGSANTVDGKKVVRLEDLPAPDRAMDVHTVYTDAKGQPPLTDADLDRFRDTAAVWFSLASGHEITTAGMDRFADWPVAQQVKVWSMVSKNIARGGYRHLGKFKNMESVQLPWSSFDDDGMDAIADLPKLAEVNAWHTNVTDAGVKRLAGRALTNLQLMGCAVGDESAKVAGGMAAMIKLDLRSTKVTDAGLAHLAGLKELKFLYLERTAVTDKGLAHLAALPALRELELANNARITDDGLKLLVGFKALVVLDVRNTKVTPDGLAAFRKARPDVNLK